MRRRALAPAACAGAALAAMLFASRLPASLDFILPRRPGWPMFAAAFEALSAPAFQAVYSALAALLLAGAAGRFLVLAAACVRGRTWSARDLASRGLALGLLVFLTRRWFAVWFDLSQKFWFPFSSLNPLEPFMNLAVCSALAFGSIVAALALLGSRPPSARRALLVWAVANALAAVLAHALHRVWSPSSAAVIAGASAPGGVRRLFVVLTEEEGRANQMAYDLPVPADFGYLDQVEHDLEKPDVGRLDVLRALYEARAKLMDPAGLRRALMLGIKHGDPLALSLLLEHLSAAPPSPGALGALGALADEKTYRIGSTGASRIALAYARLGDAAQAAVWARRAAERPRGIPAGLLDLGRGGALRPGRIAGRVEGVMPVKLALYRKAEPAAPYLLDAGALVASASPDDRGRFSFGGLPAGRYYLAFAFQVTVARRGEIRVLGHRGDLTIDAGRASLELPAFVISSVTP